jgi:hypothetical protein
MQISSGLIQKGFMTHWNQNPFLTEAQTRSPEYRVSLALSRRGTTHQLELECTTTEMGVARRVVHQLYQGMGTRMDLYTITRALSGNRLVVQTLHPEEMERVVTYLTDSRLWQAHGIGLS